MKTLFVSDLDGTLLTKEERISLYSRERINRLIEKGMIFSYATARCVSSAKNATNGLDVTAPVVLYNGGLVYDFTQSRPLFAQFFNDEQKWYLWRVLEEYGIRPFVYGADMYREHVGWIEGGETFGMKRFLSRRTADNRLMAVTSPETLLRGYVFYFKCIGPKEQLERAWNVLKFDDRFICIFHQEMYQQDFWMEISPRAATKANGVQFLKNYLHCDRVVCFGDSSNDSDMFDVCDEKYAVENADGWLKAKATGVVGFCEEDGVCKWLESNFSPECL